MEMEWKWKKRGKIKEVMDEDGERMEEEGRREEK